MDRGVKERGSLELLSSEISEKWQGFVFGWGFCYNMPVLNSLGNCYTLGNVLALQLHLLCGFLLPPALLCGTLK